MTLLETHAYELSSVYDPFGLAFHLFENVEESFRSCAKKTQDEMILCPVSCKRNEQNGEPKYQL